MIDDYIGELRVRVRTDVEDVDVVRSAAEAIVRAALERCVEILEERAPGRIVFIRRLPLRFHCDESVLDETSQVEELARLAADTVERIAIRVGLGAPPPGVEAVFFDGEAHLRAAHLVAVTTGQPSWCYDTLNGQPGAEPLAALAAPRRRLIAFATLLHLARDGVLAAVLAAQPSVAVSVLAAALGLDAPTEQQAPITNGRVEHVNGLASTVAPGNSELARELAGMAANWSPLSPDGRALTLQVHAALLLDAPVDAPEARSLATAAGLLLDAPTRSLPAVAETSRHDTVLPDPGRDEPSPAGMAGDGSSIATQCAGLFYLLDRVQELNLGESLWKACLPEGLTLAAAMSALLGARFAEDPAARLFGGVDVIGTSPDVSLEQLAEVAAATMRELAAALPRRDLAEIPPLHLALTRHPTGRLLVATLAPWPCAVFAWPADSPELLTHGLRAVLDAWPHDGVLTAEPVLVRLDTSGRVRALPGAPPTAMILPDAPSAPAAALLLLVAGSPSCLFFARADAPDQPLLEDLVRRYIAIPGNIHLSPERMDIYLAGDTLDLDLRRAGLDRDPGWLPWLGRNVYFVFGASDLTSEPPGAAPF